MNVLAVNFLHPVSLPWLRSGGGMATVRAIRSSDDIRVTCVDGGIEAYAMGLVVMVPWANITSVEGTPTIENAPGETQAPKGAVPPIRPKGRRNK